MPPCDSFIKKNCFPREEAASFLPFIQFEGRVSPLSQRGTQHPLGGAANAARKIGQQGPANVSICCMPLPPRGARATLYTASHSRKCLAQHSPWCDNQECSWFRPPEWSIRQHLQCVLQCVISQGDAVELLAARSAAAEGCVAAAQLCQLQVWGACRVCGATNDGHAKGLWRPIRIALHASMPSRFTCRWGRLRQGMVH
jgi:hypothetical protein